MVGRIIQPASTGAREEREVSRCAVEPVGPMDQCLDPAHAAFAARVGQAVPPNKTDLPHVRFSIAMRRNARTPRVGERRRISADGVE